MILPGIKHRDMQYRQNSILQTVQQLISRLERLSADSTWAHRASGMRGSLLRQLERLQQLGINATDDDLNMIDNLIRAASTILENAAREIPDPSHRRK